MCSCQITVCQALTITDGQVMIETATQGIQTTQGVPVNSPEGREMKIHSARQGGTIQTDTVKAGITAMAAPHALDHRYQISAHLTSGTPSLTRPRQTTQAGPGCLTPVEATVKLT